MYLLFTLHISKLENMAQVSKQAADKSKEALKNKEGGLENVKALIQLLFAKLFHIKTSGLEHIPKDKGAILVSNHTDAFDILLQYCYSTRKVVFLAKAEVFAFVQRLDELLEKFKHISYAQTLLLLLRPILPAVRQALEACDSWIEKHNLIVIKRKYHHEDVSYQEAVDYYAEIEQLVCRYLKEGHLISIFPEGTRTKTGVMGPFKHFPAKIALKANVPVIPAGISGAWKFLTMDSFLSGRVFRNFVHYNVGQAIYPKDFLAKEALQKASEKKRIKALTQAMQKKVYALTQAAEDQNYRAGKSKVF